MLTLVHARGEAMSTFVLFVISAGQKDPATWLSMSVVLQSIATSWVCKAIARIVPSLDSILRAACKCQRFENSSRRDLFLRVALLESYTPVATIIPLVGAVMMNFYLNRTGAAQQLSLLLLLFCSY